MDPSTGTEYGILQTEMLVGSHDWPMDAAGLFTMSIIGREREAEFSFSTTEYQDYDDAAVGGVRRGLHKRLQVPRHTLSALLAVRARDSNYSTATSSRVPVACYALPCKMGLAVRK